MNYWLLIITFIESAVIMILELVGSRLLSPYLGTSIFVWTSLIGTILASLSVGYWLGGKLADSYPKLRVLSGILCFAGVAIIFTRMANPIVGTFASYLGIEAGTIVAALILFAPPTIALAMVTPFVVRLTMKNVEHSGRTVGTIYALSNIGSIVGTFLGGFFLISYIGSQTILIYLSILTFIAASIAYAQEKKFPITPLVIMLVLVGSAFMKDPLPIPLPFEKATLIADVDTRYSRNWIYQYPDAVSGRTIQVLTNSTTGQQSAILLDNPEELLFPYLKDFVIAEAALPNYSHALLIGGSTYTYPRSLLARFPEKTIDVVEIDPELTDLAKQYFKLKPDPRLSIIHKDGRIFLNTNTKKYDAIFVDAFLSNDTIPHHLTTVEAVQKIQSGLTNNGIVVVNVISAVRGEGGQFAAALFATYKDVFPHVYLLKVNPARNDFSIQNLVLVASLEPLDFTKQTLKRFAPKVTKDPENGIVLTDDFAPLDRLLAPLH